MRPEKARSSDIQRIDIFQSDGEFPKAGGLVQILFS